MVATRLLGVLVAGLGAYGTPAHALELRISEVLYDAVGADDGKVFVELYGVPGLLLDGYRLSGVNGADGRVGPLLRLSGSVPLDGFFVIAGGGASGTSVLHADLVLQFDLQNGPDSLQLSDPAGTILDALGYGTFGPGDVFAGEGDPAPDVDAGSSLARLFADVDTDWNAHDFRSLDVPTPGSGPTQVPEPAELVPLCAALIFCLTWRHLRHGGSRNPPGC